MNRIKLLLSSSLLVATSANAQLFTDDFESYSVGDYLGPASTEWTTWSGTEGGAEDVQVTNAQASSGSNSIFFSSTSANGGPQDVILDFGQQFTNGIFSFESDFYVEAGNNGYFNFQATPTPGTTWAMNCNMANGSISIDDGNTPDLAVGSYQSDTWFTLRIEANLSTGRWQAFADGVCFGVWANSVNQIASADFYPIQGSSFYMDDVSFDHQTYTSPALNATVSGFDLGGKISGLTVYPTVTVSNAGTDPITSFDVSVNLYGDVKVENVTGVNLTAGQSMEVNFSNGYSLVDTQAPGTATVYNVNGGSDGDASDDDACLLLNPVIPAPGKVVVGEEATGTWCPWCVRGTVFMDNFEKFNQFWAGIAVHNNDPMANVAYDAAVNNLVTGYPSALVDRKDAVDPSAMSTDFYERLTTPPTAIISNASVWNSTTRELQVTVTADFQMNATDAYRLAAVITEDGVTGTASGYAQANAYAGGSNGPMGGYELLPSPVPASQMVYDHVAREILPSFDGDPNSFPATVNAGEQHARTFTFTLAPEWDETKIKIIGLLIAPDGKIDNAGKSIIGSDTGLDELTTATFKMYPNPSSTVTLVDAGNTSASEMSIRILDMTGKVVSEKVYGMTAPGTKLPIVTSLMDSGVYIVELNSDGTLMTKQLIVE
ncbi:Omp28-related outer membrane protein [Crocinitomicaceae bacterium]|nr:Omp28-related outer membrane protein [Crocinitomicaceae bacterium]